MPANMTPIWTISTTINICTIISFNILQNIIALLLTTIIFIPSHHQQQQWMVGGCECQGFGDDPAQIVERSQWVADVRILEKREDWNKMTIDYTAKFVNIYKLPNNLIGKLPANIAVNISTGLDDCGVIDLIKSNEYLLGGETSMNKKDGGYSFHMDLCSFPNEHDVHAVTLKRLKMYLQNDRRYQLFNFNNSQPNLLIE